MRKSFDSRQMMAEHIIRRNPFCGHLLVFCYRRGDRIKILYWDRDGWAIWYKRLEAGPFELRSPRRDARRSPPGSWGCYWRESICTRGGAANGIACRRRRCGVPRASLRQGWRREPERSIIYLIISIIVVGVPIALRY
jgi:transposase